ncbi:MAG: BamA/TamA family outer membrane protein [Gemmatimonadetes bacterium]|nr:BamA/TamA family outer membrane protein [Gemmatimonadota bacterium]
MRHLRAIILLPVLAAAAHASTGDAHAQRSTLPPTAADSLASFADEGTASLVRRARAARVRTDHSIRSYTAIVRSRIAAALRMPLKDRTLFRQETAARVRWSRDAETVVQMLAARTQHPGGVEAPKSPSGMGIDELFDPGEDRMYFGLGNSTREDDNDDFWIEHPLGDAAERHYRFASGDTLTVRLQDGLTVRAIELRVTPRRDDPHTVRGTLWIDAGSGALVQAAYRLARTVDIMRDMDAIDDDDREDIGKVPGFLKPFEFDITLMTVEYSLWEMEHWLPRTMRFEGMARAGVLRFPAATDLNYDMLDVELDSPDAAARFRGTEDDSARARHAHRIESEAAQRVAAEWGVAEDVRTIERKNKGRQVMVLVPRDSAALLNSDQLPPPIWSDAPGFATRSELDELSSRLASLGGPVRRDITTHFGWGFGEGEMLRYNRVEALSIGARFAAALPQLDAAATVRFGLGDLHPNAELALRRETMVRTLELRGYHELATVDPARAALGVGNSLSALMFGRDAGEYFRASGAALTWAPPPASRRAWDATAYAEYQNDVARTTHIALPRLWTDSVFRRNITAAEAMQYGGTLRLMPWWGTDPARPQFGIEMLLQGETGDFDLARASITLRGAAHLVHGLRVGAEVAAGSTAGDVTPQRLFYLGGANTLRGYEPGTVAGTSMARGRLEIARTASFGAVALFTDWGWAGDREDIRSANQRWAVGVGTSLLDGLLRLDLAHGLRNPRGWRLDLHLDSVL